MSILSIGILAVFAISSRHCRDSPGEHGDDRRRAGRREMERFRAGRYDTLGLDATEVAALVTAENPDVYAADEAYVRTRRRQR